MFTIRLIGDAGVGKSAFLRAASEQVFSENDSHHNSNMVDCIKTTVTLPGSEEAVALFLDGGGKMAKDNPDAVFLMFALDDEDSFDHLNDYLPKAPKTITFVVGCKTDKAAQRSINYEAWAKEHKLPYWEVSAKTGENIKTLLIEITDTLLQVNAFAASIDEGNHVANVAHHVNHAADEPEAPTYDTLMKKLSLQPDNEDYYPSIPSIADDIASINKITQTLEDAKHKKDRAHFREALTATLKHHYFVLMNEWDHLDTIKTAITALKAIKNKLSIIQPKATQGYRAKSAMLDLEHFIDELNKHLELSFLKIKLDGEKAVENETERKILNLTNNNQADRKLEEKKDQSQCNQIKDAIALLAKAPLLSPDFLRHLVNNHLLSPINKNKLPELVTAMKALSDEEKNTLKDRLIEATQLEMLDKKPPENKKTATHLALEDGMKNPESNIPLIAILRISGSGKIHANTDHYKTWANYMKGKVDPATQGYLGTFWKRSKAGMTQTLGHIKKPKLPM